MIHCQDSAAEFPYLLGEFPDVSLSRYRYLMEVFSEEAIQGAIIKAVEELVYSSLCHSKNLL